MLAVCSNVGVLPGLLCAAPQNHHIERVTLDAIRDGVADTVHLAEPAKQRIQGLLAAGVTGAARRRVVFDACYMGLVEAQIVPFATTAFEDSITLQRHGLERLFEGDGGQAEPLGIAPTVTRRPEGFGPELIRRHIRFDHADADQLIEFSLSYQDREAIFAAAMTEPSPFEHDRRILGAIGAFGYLIQLSKIWHTFFGLSLLVEDPAEDRVEVRLPSLSLFEGICRALYGAETVLTIIPGQLSRTTYDQRWSAGDRMVALPIRSEFFEDIQADVPPLAITAHDMLHVGVNRSDTELDEMNARRFAARSPAE